MPKGSYDKPGRPAKKPPAQKPSKKPPAKKPLKLDLKEGTFTRMAKDKGYGDKIQKFATDIMKHKDKGVLPNGVKISKLMIAKANFVVNSRSWNK